MKILETRRTILREVTPDDAAFILDLLNQPSFIEYIGDRNVRTLKEANDYIESRFLASYRQFGFGMWAVELKESEIPIGICGFVKRDFLPDADIGFAFLAEFERQGYGFETAGAALEYGRNILRFGQILAITSPHNEASEKLLGKIGFKFDKLIETSPGAQAKLFRQARPIARNEGESVAGDLINSAEG